MPLSFSIFGSFTAVLLVTVGIVNAIKWLAAKAKRR
jgi:hypothetical protein